MVERIRLVIVALHVLILWSCASTDLVGFKKHDPVSSPNGEIDAYVYEYKRDNEASSAEVYLVYKMGCVQRLASFSGEQLEIRLEWHSDTRLAIAYPKGSAIVVSESATRHECFVPIVNVDLAQFQAHTHMQPDGALH